MRLFSSHQRKTDSVDMGVIHKKNSIRLSHYLLCLALLLVGSGTGLCQGTILAQQSVIPQRDGH